MTDPNIKQTRVQLPVHDPAGKASVLTPAQPAAGEGSATQKVASSEFSQPVDSASVSPPLSAPVMPAPEPPSSELKKETARIQLTPEPVPSADQMKNAESVIPVPHVVPQNSSIGAEAARKKTSMFLSWILLAVSALILIIQIWIYLS